MDAVKERAAQLGLDVHSDAFAKEMDNADELASYRSEFHIPKKVPGDESCEEDCIYLCGNSLGLQPKVLEGRVVHELKKWQTYGVEGHFVQTHEHSPGWAVIDQDATPMANIVGAKPSEVAICNTLSVNLHLLLVAFYRPEGKRVKILMEAKAFPSDQYAMESHMRQRGISPEEHLIEMEPREGEATLRTEDILSVINQQGDEIALVLFGGLQYYTGQFFDVEEITKAGHEKGCIVGWDFAHAAGNIDLKLHEWDIDFACWCTYKVRHNMENEMDSFLLFLECEFAFVFLLRSIYPVIHSPFTDVLPFHLSLSAVFELRAGFTRWPVCARKISFFPPIIEGWPSAFRRVVGK
uniref:Aminotransferase class V domain-containing protein n=1 Tax=Palpitomonas bilix TaxID=652834 RepID=A0A7S3DDY8_9EUKA|mmetsp:Transcript_33797/g.86698  ORF Transcript_33797/g.86698 Transcript_33797/m.86698 type:complete len:352 (+) Transcript_33797:69-1124(+)